MSDQQSTEDHSTIDDSADAIRAALNANYPPFDDEELSELWSAAILDYAIAPNDMLCVLATVDALTARLAAVDGDAARLRTLLTGTLTATNTLLSTILDESEEMTGDEFDQFTQDIRSQLDWNMAALADVPAAAERE